MLRKIGILVLISLGLTALVSGLIEDNELRSSMGTTWIVLAAILAEIVETK
jgi:hypothetical protein